MQPSFRPLLVSLATSVTLVVLAIVAILFIGPHRLGITLSISMLSFIAPIVGSISVITGLLARQLGSRTWIIIAATIAGAFVSLPAFAIAGLARTAFPILISCGVGASMSVFLLLIAFGGTKLRAAMTARQHTAL
jgi:hypothetical protein